MLDLQRRVHQLDDDAGQAARNHQLRGDLPLAPPLRERRLPRVVRGHPGRPRHGRGRRRPDHRQRRRAGRRLRAHYRPGHRETRQKTLRRWEGQPDRRRRDEADARADAPGHGHDHGRRRHLHRLRRPGDAADAHCASRKRRTDQRHPQRPGGHVPRHRPGAGHRRPHRPHHASGLDGRRTRAVGRRLQLAGHRPRRHRRLRA